MYIENITYIWHIKILRNLLFIKTKLECFMKNIKNV